jgi:hypothetical protein
VFVHFVVSVCLCVCPYCVRAQEVVSRRKDFVFEWNGLMFVSLLVVTCTL